MHSQTNKLLAGRFFVVQSAITIVMASLMAYLPYHGRVPPGIFLGGTNLSGLTKEEALHEVDLWARQRGEGFLLDINGRGYWISYKAIGVTYPFRSVSADVAAMVENENAPARPSVVASAFRTLRSAVHPIRLNQVPEYDPARIDTVLKTIAAAAARPAMNATVNWRDNRLEIVPEQAGRELDIAATLRQIETYLQTNGTGTIQARVKAVEPEITAAKLRQARDLVGIYVTRFNPNQINRTHNIRLASKALSGALVPPGMTFSLNERLGPRGKEIGYREAPVFNNQKVVKDVGGGICQVATTLYNAVLQAGFPVDERAPHSKPVTYVPLGQDATIAGNLIDLKFHNQTPYPVLIVASVDNDRLTVALFGRQTGRQDVKIVTENEEVAPRVVVRTDPQLAPGETKVLSKGAPGYYANVYRVVSQDGKVTAKELVSRDFYRPRNTVLAVGPKPPAGK